MTGDKPTPESFNLALSLTPPTAGRTPENLATYLTSKGYLDFGALPTAPVGTLSPGTGFWVNRR